MELLEECQLPEDSVLLRSPSHHSAFSAASEVNPVITQVIRKKMEVNSAEREASEVLHSLLSVERLQKPLTSNTQIIIDESHDKEGIQWHTPVQHSLFATLEQTEFGDSGNVSVVVWDALNIQDGGATLVQNQPECTPEIVAPQIVQDGAISSQAENLSTPSNSDKKKPPRKKYSKTFYIKSQDKNSTVEDSLQEVRSRFELGCECADDSCFKGLNPEAVYRHRLNIAELTKEEHDMYLMGVTMACMADPSLTAKQRERQRLRSHYVHHGRKVCLSAFLYLENCTLYQVKRIRKHVMTHGVTPRVHGNHGKKPHNVFSFDIYRKATDFLKEFIAQHSSSSGGNSKGPVILPADVTRRTVHNLYQEYVKKSAPSDEKIMGYSTFRHFMKEQFPQLRFAKTDLGVGNVGSNPKAPTTRTTKVDLISDPGESSHCGFQEGPAGRLTIPLIIEQGPFKAEQGPAYILAPGLQLVQSQIELPTFQQPATLTTASTPTFQCFQVQ